MHVSNVRTKADLNFSRLVLHLSLSLSCLPPKGGNPPPAGPPQKGPQLTLPANERVAKSRGRRSCFASFVANKAIKRLEVLQRETRPDGRRLPTTPQRYLLALSCGPSSTALLHILHENLRQQRERGRPLRFELLVAHVVFDAVDDDDDDDECNGSDAGRRPQQEQGPPLTPPLLDRYRARFPGTEIRTVGLSSVLDSPCVDWSALPVSPPPPSLPSSSSSSPLDRRRRLAELFARLPSATSRADVRRLLTRHALLAAAAAEHRRAVVLLGHSTTALAELVLAETAKGRGFSLPWQVNDGSVFPVPVVAPAVPAPSVDSGEGEGEGEETEAAMTGTTTATTTTTITTTATAIKMISIYHPLRELFRKELLSYAAITSPPLAELLPADSLFPRRSGNRKGGGGGGGTAAAAVVSHKDLSIDDVMARYFGEVEASYPSVVANVVRTTGKLVRAAAHGGGRAEEREREREGAGGGEEGTGRCGLCGIALDRSGDERWRGEIGEEGPGEASGTLRRGGLCYGCERSTRA